MTKRIYLAGPEVFLQDPHAAGAAKKGVCARFGLQGVFPLDNDLDLAELTPEESGLHISQANERLIRDADAIIANMTPFRGPSMDVGTAFEMGFGRALGIPVLGYTNVAELFLHRSIAITGARQQDDRWIDAEEMSLEDFSMTDNLMLDGAVIASGFQVFSQATPPETRFTDLTAFEKCVRTLADYFQTARAE